MTTDMGAPPGNAGGTDRRVLLLPGWQDSGATHWQSRWEALHGYRRVQQDDWLWPRRGDWMTRLEETLLEDPTPAVLVAHSLGCGLGGSLAVCRASACSPAGRAARRGTRRHTSEPLQLATDRASAAAVQIAGGCQQR